MEVDLIPKNVISVTVWIHPGPGSGPLSFQDLVLYPLSSEDFQQTVNWVTKELHFVNVYVCPKRVCNSHYIHVLLDGL